MLKGKQTFSSFGYYTTQAKLKINGRQSCLEMGLTTSVTTESPNNPGASQ